MGLDGAFGDAEPSGDLFVGEALGDELEDLGLAGAERDLRLASVEQHPGGARIERCATGGGGPYRGDQVVGISVFELVADRSGLEGGGDPGGVREGCEHDDGDVGVV